MAIALVSSVAAGGSGNSSAIDTTGATLLVLLSVSWDPVTTPTDSKGNTWTGLTAKVQSGRAARLWYVANPTVGTGHTFLHNSGSGSSNCLAAAFGGVKVSSPFDVENGFGANDGTSRQAGSVTPSEDNELIISALMHDTLLSGPASINSGFTIAVADNTVSFYGALAYKVQTTAGAENPTWTHSYTSTGIALAATFKAEAGSSFQAAWALGSNVLVGAN